MRPVSHLSLRGGRQAAVATPNYAKVAASSTIPEYGTGLRPVNPFDFRTITEYTGPHTRRRYKEDTGGRPNGSGRSGIGPCGSNWMGLDFSPPRGLGCMAGASLDPAKGTR